MCMQFGVPSRGSGISWVMASPRAPMLWKGEVEVEPRIACVLGVVELVTGEENVLRVNADFMCAWGIGIPFESWVVKSPMSRVADL